MRRSIAGGLAGLSDHAPAGCMLLALLTLSLLGVGEARTVSAVGLILCAVGMVQRSAQADLWILVPLLLYNLLGMASTFAVYGNITSGYGPLHMVFPVLYLLLACLTREEARLLRRLCLLWVGAAALHGIGLFVFQAVVRGRAARLGGLLGNPNALGIFLVLGWFALMRCRQEEPSGGRWGDFLPYGEPVLLFALALTLSMGSFLAMAVGILVLFLEKKRAGPWREALFFLLRLLSKATLGVGTGLFLYLGAARTGAAWICLPLLLYAGAMVLCWRRLEAFLEAYPRTAAVIAGAGVLVAAAAVAIRPSSIATFAERLEMMGNGLGYLVRSPLLGVGPFQWRALNLYDSDKYFNTWHIHNLLIHAGAEFGCFAMAMLAAIGVRFFRKKPDPASRAGFAAFCVHNMMDTSFFYLGITSLVILTAGDPQKGGKRLGSAGVRLLFGLFAALYAYFLFCSVRSA